MIDQLNEPYYVTKEAKERATKLEKETVGYEQAIIDLHYKIRHLYPAHRAADQWRQWPRSAK
ncbi:MAG: hypothetical protein CME21_16625 [Gemmatimonadetes bacterium]|nr:hypothetical protein [Gemmatimonadota bacterium]HCK11626.1 hypothetical protein [Candidatus Latescibacterota bacterium]